MSSFRGPDLDRGRRSDSGPWFFQILYKQLTDYPTYYVSSSESVTRRKSYLTPYLPRRGPSTLVVYNLLWVVPDTPFNRSLLRP